MKTYFEGEDFNEEDNEETELFLAINDIENNLYEHQQRGCETCYFDKPCSFAQALMRERDNYQRELDN